MSKKYKIVHISQTPLVAAPSKIALSQRIIGHDSIAVALKDYPGALAGKFTEDYLFESEFTQDAINRSISEADIIHVHNDITSEYVEKLLELNQTAKYVYQVHSALREGPLYLKRDSSLGLPFALKLVVAQHQTRHYSDYTFVPNIITETPSLRTRKKDEKLRVLFSPTHARPGRWGNKMSFEMENAIEALASLGKIEAVRPLKPVSPKTLFAIRRTCHVSIDEIATGGFHQVSLEGLAAGTVTINRADYFCKKVLSNFSDGVVPPFLTANGSNIAEIIEGLANDWAGTAKIQTESFNYFNQYLIPSKMAQVFDKAYESI